MLLRWTLLLTLLACWQLIAGRADLVFFPPPTEIANQARLLWLTGADGGVEITASALTDIVPSLTRLSVAWLAAAVLGIGLGALLGRSRAAMDYVAPLFAFFRSIPAPALIPVFLLLFGIGTSMKVTLIIFGAIWPILLNTVDGVRSVGRVPTETARAFRTPQPQWILGVVFPAAMPKIFAGLRSSLAIAVILMVMSEMVGATNGIGYQLVDAKTNFEYTSVWAWIVLLAVLGYLLNTLLAMIEHRVLRWMPQRAPTAQRARR